MESADKLREYPSGRSTIELLLARVADLHRFRFLAAAILVPLEGVMVLVDDLYHFANLRLHSGHRFHFPERFRGGMANSTSLTFLRSLTALFA
jgi:hypothetical protein